MKTITGHEKNGIRGLLKPFCEEWYCHKVACSNSGYRRLTATKIAIASRHSPFCWFRKYIISRKHCEGPLSVPWNPRNQVSQVTVCLTLGRTWSQRAHESTLSWSQWVGAAALVCQVVTKVGLREGSCCLEEVAKLGPRGLMWPCELFYPVGKTFTIIPPKAKWWDGWKKIQIPPPSPSMLTCPLKKVGPKIISSWTNLQVF